MSSHEIIGAAYARMSSKLQSEKSPADQVRVCRGRADADGAVIPDENVFIDQAVSGLKPDRNALAELKAAAETKQFSVLYVEDLSRLSRESTHLMALLKQLVFEGIRIVSVNEGIDSANESWLVLATILGLQHENYVKDLAPRVRRGQEGAILDDLSAGDTCVGFTSTPVPGSGQQRRGRNPRPSLRVVIDQQAALWIVWIFKMFAIEGKSMNWIADELTRLNVPKDHRATTRGWHHTYIKRILTNEKYIGIWTWGRRRNKRNPATGKIIQVAATKAQITVRQRPNLRIVPMPLWGAAQKRLRRSRKPTRDRTVPPADAQAATWIITRSTSSPASCSVLIAVPVSSRPVRTANT